MSAFDGFEKTSRGDLPVDLLASHPDGRYVALQTQRAEGAIWEQESKRLVWAPRNAIAFSWLKQGTQIAGLFEPESERYEFRLFSWPEKQVLQTCPVVKHEDWGYHLFQFWVAPQETFALFLWLNQTEFGFEWVDITPQGMQQDDSAGFFFEGTNTVSQPAFSPTGHWWACAYLDDLWWSMDPEDPDPEQPAPGGEYTMGALLIFEEKKRPPRRIPLVATFPPGWLPKELLDVDAFMIETADPIFLDEQRVQIQLPTGEVQIHSL